MLEKKRTSKGEAQLSQLRSILDYLTHVKLTHAIHRNLLLIETMRTRGGGRGPGAGKAGPGGGGGGKVAKPEEFVRVYDILLQVCSNYVCMLGITESLHHQAILEKCKTFLFKWRIP